MANFQITITNPTTGLVDITDLNDVLTLVDHSNYDDAAPEAGHNQADFDEFRKLRIVLPTGTTYAFSSLYPADGSDADLATPAGASLPMSTAYSYTTGDGKYVLTLYALPTWGIGYDYLISTAPYVTYDGLFYKALRDTTADQPDVSASDWEAVTIDNISSKYRLVQTITITSDMQEVWARLTYIANCVNNKIDCYWEDLFRDEAWIDAVRLCQIQESIPVLMKVDAWEEITTNINFSKVIAAKYGY